MNAQLFGCSWVGAIFNLVNNYFSKMVRGRRKKTFLKMVA